MARRPRHDNPKRYLRVWDPAQRKMVLLHRRIAAELLGRPLLPEEVVHHRDGNSLNNAPENLEVLASQRHHMHVEYHQKRRNGGQYPLAPEWLPAVVFVPGIPDPIRLAKLSSDRPRYTTRSPRG